MAELIIIRGEQNSGKTTTAGLVYQELLKHADKKHKFNDQEVILNSLRLSNKGETWDFTAILNIGGKQIAIVSAGDVASILKVKISILIEIEVDIIICCSRSVNRTGSSYRMILDTFAKENNIALEIYTKFSKNKQEKDEVKQAVVKRIVDKVLGVVMDKQNEVLV